MGEAERVTVHVKYRDVEQTFSGDVNDVWVSVNRFFGEFVPAFDVARKVSLTVDLAGLIEDFRNVVAVAPEGPEVLVPKERLTDGEALQLYLIAAYIGFRVGKLTRESLSKEDLASKLGKSSKITATRLGELVKEGVVAKVEEGGYRMTAFGIKRFSGFDLSCSRS